MAQKIKPIWQDMLTPNRDFNNHKKRAGHSCGPPLYKELLKSEDCTRRRLNREDIKLFDPGVFPETSYIITSNLIMP